jgi:hypothetical protein
VGGVGNKVNLNDAYDMVAIAAFGCFATSRRKVTGTSLEKVVSELTTNFCCVTLIWQYAVVDIVSSLLSVTSSVATTSLSACCGCVPFVVGPCLGLRLGLCSSLKAPHCRSINKLSH